MALKPTSRLCIAVISYYKTTHHNLISQIRIRDMITPNKTRLFRLKNFCQSLLTRLGVTLAEVQNHSQRCQAPYIYSQNTLITEQRDSSPFKPNSGIVYNPRPVQSIPYSKNLLLVDEFNSILQGRVLTPASSRLFLTAVARVRFQCSPCGICGGQSDDVLCFSPRNSVSSCHIIPLMPRKQCIHSSSTDATLNIAKQTTKKLATLAHHCTR